MPLLLCETIHCPDDIVEVLLDSLEIFLRPLWQQIGRLKKCQELQVSMPFRAGDVDGPRIFAVSGSLPT